MNRLIVGLFIVPGLLLAMGDKPVDNKVAQNTQRVAPAELSQEALYNRGLKSFLAARESGYDAYCQNAVSDFEAYVATYPTANNRYEALYYLSKSYELVNDLMKQADTLTLYLTEAPTADVFQPYAQADQGGLLVLRRNYSDAKKSFDEALTRITDNVEFTVLVYQKSIPVYESENNQKELIRRFTYLIDHKDSLPNKQFIPVYTYRLGQLYLAEGNTVKARAYFTRVANDVSPAARTLSESAKGYIEKLDKTK